MTNYVAGFLMDLELQNVALVTKNRPEWQAGKLNGIGGHIEEGEDAWGAMRREFHEETGLDVTNWEEFVEVSGDWGVVHFFRAAVPRNELRKVKTMEDEHIGLYHIDVVLSGMTGASPLPNLSWILPLARYAHDRYQVIEVFEEISGTEQT